MLASCEDIGDTIAVQVQEDITGRAILWLETADFTLEHVRL
jgi:hypothetical protein